MEHTEQYSRLYMVFLIYLISTNIKIECRYKSALWGIRGILRERVTWNHGILEPTLVAANPNIQSGKGISLHNKENRIFA